MSFLETLKDEAAAAKSRNDRYEQIRKAQQHLKKQQVLPRMQEIYLARDTAIRIMDGQLEGTFEETTYYHMPERNLGGMGDEQFGYFREVIRQHPNVRWTFLLMHKPLWLLEDGMGLSRGAAPLLYTCAQTRPCVL